MKQQCCLASITCKCNITQICRHNFKTRWYFFFVAHKLFPELLTGCVYAYVFRILSAVSLLCCILLCSFLNLHSLVFSFCSDRLSASPLSNFVSFKFFISHLTLSSDLSATLNVHLNQAVLNNIYTQNLRFFFFFFNFNFLAGNYVMVLSGHFHQLSQHRNSNLCIAGHLFFVKKLLFVIHLHSETVRMIYKLHGTEYILGTY